MAGKERKTEAKNGGGEAERKDVASSYVATVKLEEEGFHSFVTIPIFYVAGGRPT